LIDARLTEALVEVKQRQTAGPFNTADGMIASLNRVEAIGDEEIYAPFSVNHALRPSS
jgi:hypothetical protein